MPIVSVSCSAATAPGAAPADSSAAVSAMRPSLIRQSMPAMVEEIASTNSSSFHQLWLDGPLGCLEQVLPPENNDESKNPSKRLSPQELSGVLQRHRRFVSQLPGGTRANLSFHDLSGVDLTDCDLTGADLSGARLQ